MDMFISRLAEAGCLIIRKDKCIFAILRQLKKEIKKTPDHLHAGALCFTEAYAAYHFGKYGKLCRHIHRAVSHLLRCNDTRILTRSYNLFAVNAQRIWKVTGA